jgi:ribosomal protein L7/L12
MPEDGTDSRLWQWLRPVRISRAAQQEADRRTGEQLVAILDKRSRAEVDGLLKAGKPIPAVRRVRELTGLRLIDAKRLVESLRH